jgi:hypothetical protein
MLAYSEAFGQLRRLQEPLDQQLKRGCICLGETAVCYEAADHFELAL